MRRRRDLSGDAVNPVTDPDGRIIYANAAARALMDLIQPGITIVGRQQDCDVRFEQKSVSKQHCVLVKSHGLVMLRDLGSTNGTYVNRDRIDTVVLKDTDEVQIGKYRLVFFQGHENQ